MVAQFVQNNLQIDWTSATLHLETLGYSRGNQVGIRYINPSTSKATKADGLEFKQMEQLQSQGFNAYVVVNPGGHSDNDITAGRVIFYEHDNLDKSVQTDLWQSLGLPEPTLQVDTGGKSVHSYWGLSEPVDVPTWKKLQSDLLEFSDADKTIKNPSRVMRLAGSLYINKSGEAVGVAQIIRKSDKKYTLEELRRIIPEKSAVNSQQLPITNYLTSDIPLHQCLSKTDRDLIDHGSGEGSRNDSGAKLARNLIGTANRLQHLGHRYEGDPRQLFDDYCSHCSPPLDTREADIIWKSASNDNPTATLTDDAIENCVKAWQKNQGVKERSQQSPKQNNVIPHPTLTKLSAKELKAKIADIIDKDLSKVETELELHDLAGTANKPIRELRDLYNLIKADKEQEQDKKDLEKIQIPKLFDAKKSRLHGFDFLYGDGGHLAAMLHEQADSMPTAFEHLFSTLLPAVGSVIGTSSTIVINTSESYTQPCIFQTLILGKSGDLKSPTQRLIVKPLEELENIEREKYQKELEQYKEELVAFKKDPENNREPDKPSLKRYIIGALSQEAKIKLHCENPRGLLQLRDEWSGFISGRNKFRNGQGDDLELELSEFDGGSLRRDLVNSDNSAYVAKSAFNKTGNTQIETLRSILQKQGFDDHKGEFSRWLPSLVTVPFKELDLFAGDSGLSARISTSLKDLYIGCSQLPEKQYFLSIAAKKLCQELISRLRRLNNETDDAGWNTIYPKIQGYLCRFILWIHLTNSVLAGNLNPEQMIDRQCVASAGKLVKFYLDQHLLLRALFTPEQKIEGDYLKIKDYLDRKACKKSVREIKAGVKGLRSLTTAEIKKMCDQMVNWGVLGMEEKTYYSVDFVDQNQQNVDLLEKNLNTPQTNTQQGFQDFEKNQNVDFVDLLLTNEQKAENHIQQGLKAIENGQNIDFVDPTPKFFQSPLVDHADPTPELTLDLTPDNSIFWGRSTNDDQNVPQNHTQQGVDHDTKRSTKSTFENYQNSETFDGQGFAANQDFLEKVNKGQQRSTNEGQKYQIGDRINCYPTMEHESNDWKVKATIISIEYEQGYILTCTVSYKNRKKEDRTAVIAGGKSDDWLLGKV